jgi:hypothetical protein
MPEREPQQSSLAEILDRLLELGAKDGIASFRKLAEAAHLDPSCDFIGASLRNIDMRDEDLRGFDFSNADLTGSDFRRANVQGVRFNNANLESVIGLRDVALSAPEIQFLKELSELNPAETWVLTPERTWLFAHAIQQYAAQISNADLPEEAQLVRCIKEFVYNVCLFNFASNPDNKELYEEKARRQWLILYQYVEIASSSLLANVLMIKPDAEQEIFAEALQAKNVNVSGWVNSVRLIGQHYEWPQEAYRSGFAEKIRRRIELVGQLRNEAAYHSFSWQRQITIAGDNGTRRFEELDEKISAMCELIAELSWELQRRNLKLPLLSRLL